MSSREIGIGEAAAIVPLVLVILVLAFYPQFVLRRTESTLTRTVAVAQYPIAYGVSGSAPLGGGTP